MRRVQASSWMFIASALALAGPTSWTRSADAAEPAVCRGVQDRAEASLLTSRKTLGVRELRRRSGKQMRLRTYGAEIGLAPRPGDSAALLGRMARCHMALSSAVDDTADPLTLSNIHVVVREHPDHFGLRITSKNRRVARQIVERARRAHTANERSELKAALDS